MGALALLVTAILATLVLYFWARKAQLEKQLLEEREENERMMSVAEDLERRLSHLKQQKKNTPALGVDVLDRLCQQYYVYEGTDNLQPRIVKEVRSVVEGLRTDAAMQRSLEQALNKQPGDGETPRLFPPLERRRFSAVFIHRFRLFFHYAFYPFGER